MKITSAKYETSVVDKNNLIKDGKTEFAFVGRSNVGKSSLINIICNQKNLAKTSSTPGLTKMINYFLINDSFRIVDLPGYGYAKTGQKHIANWAGLMESYLTISESLKTVFVLMDCRHEPSQLDRMMLDFLQYEGLPFVIVATKVDKISKTKISPACEMIARNLKVRKEIVIPFSSSNGQGKDEILNYIESQF